MVALADAVVVLGCAVLRGGAPSAALARRIRLGVQAFEQGAAPLVVASGGRRWHGQAEAQCIGRELLAAGVPERAVALELCSLSTVDNALYCSRLLKGRGARRALIATSAWHLSRAMRDFELFGLEAVAPPAAWLRAVDEPAAPWLLRAREAVSARLDALLAARAAAWGADFGAEG